MISETSPLNIRDKAMSGASIAGADLVVTSLDDVSSLDTLAEGRLERVRVG